MFWSGVSKVIFAASSQDLKSVLGAPALSTTCAEVLYNSDPHVEVVGGFLREQAMAILNEFAVKKT